MSTFTHILRRFGRRDEGQALVEFALVMPFLLLFLVGIVEFGRAWNAYIVVTQATREGARQAAVFDEAGIITSATIEGVINEALATAKLDTNATTIALDNWNGGTGQPLTVTVTQPYSFVFFARLMEWATGERNISLKSSFTMRNE